MGGHGVQVQGTQPHRDRARSQAVEPTCFCIPTRRVAAAPGLLRLWRPTPPSVQGCCGWHESGVVIKGARCAATHAGGQLARGQARTCRCCTRECVWDCAQPAHHHGCAQFAAVAADVGSCCGRAGVGAQHATCPVLLGYARRCAHSPARSQQLQSAQSLQATHAGAALSLERVKPHPG